MKVKDREEYELYFKALKPGELFQNEHTKSYFLRVEVCTLDSGHDVNAVKIEDGSLHGFLDTAIVLRFPHAFVDLNLET